MEFKLSREVSPTNSGGSFHFRSHDEIPKGAMFSIPEKYTNAGISANFEVIGALLLQDNLGNLYQAVPAGNKTDKHIEIVFPIEKGKIFRTL